MLYTYHNNHFPTFLNLMTTPLVDVKCCFKFLPYINLVSFRKLSFDGLSMIHKKWFFLILFFSGISWQILYWEIHYKVSLK